MAGVVAAGWGCQDQEFAPTTENQGPSLSVAADSLAEERYIVVLKPGLSDRDRVMDEIAAGAGARIERRFQHALEGFSAMVPTRALEALRRNPNVEIVERDGTLYATETQLSPTSWGLDRIDQHPLPLN